jgi:hypothetical protein
VTAAFYAIKLTLPHMRRRNFGRIFNMTSVYGSRATPNRVDYVTTKAALLGLTRAVALENLEYDVTCHGICPGSVLTPGTEVRVRRIMNEKGLPREAAERVLKLVNNMLSVAALAITSEGMVMGVKAGLDPSVMLDIINASSGRNSATTDKFPRAVLPRTFDFGFATGLSVKDIRLCLQEADALGVPMPVGSVVQQILSITNALYGPQSDFTSICKTVEQWEGLRFGAVRTSSCTRTLSKSRQRQIAL